MKPYYLCLSARHVIISQFAVPSHLSHRASLAIVPSFQTAPLSKFSRHKTKVLLYRRRSVLRLFYSHGLIVTVTISIWSLNWSDHNFLSMSLFLALKLSLHHLRCRQASDKAQAFNGLSAGPQQSPSLHFYKGLCDPLGRFLPSWCTQPPGLHVDPWHKASSDQQHLSR